MPYDVTVSSDRAITLRVPNSNSVRFVTVATSIKHLRTHSCYSVCNYLPCFANAGYLGKFLKVYLWGTSLREDNSHVLSGTE
jgi:hypothetical protein